MRHVVFRLGSDRYALPLSSVREVVVPPDRYTLIPRAPPSVCGVMNLRGRVITIVDGTRLLGGHPNEGNDVRGRNERIVLLDRGRRDLGLLVSDVEGIEEITLVELPPDPPAGEALQPDAKPLRGMAQVREWRVAVLDPEQVDGLVNHAFEG